MTQSQLCAPKRSAPFDQEPGYYEPAKLWLYGNVRLLHAKLTHVPAALGPPIQRPSVLQEIESEAERMVLDSHVLVCGIHNAAHQRTAVVPLRWGSPRVLVLSGGFLHHLGPKLADEPFRVARLWRYAFDASCDPVVSRRSPEKLPTYAHHNPTVDRLVRGLAQCEVAGLSSPFDSLTALIARV